LVVFCHQLFYDVLLLTIIYSYCLEIIFHLVFLLHELSD